MNSGVYQLRSTVTGETEEFRSVPSLPGYRVSDAGRVWTCWRLVGLGPGTGKGTRARVMGREWRELKPQALPSGYRYIHIDVAGGHRRRRQIRYVHQLVAEAFLGPCPDGQQVRHDNGNPADNRAANLLYGTKLENEADKLRHGTRVRGSKHGIAKLDEPAVLAIKKRLARGERRQDIAADNKVTVGAIGCIARGETWGHLTLPETPAAVG